MRRTTILKHSLNGVTSALLGLLLFYCTPPPEPLAFVAGEPIPLLADRIGANGNLTGLDRPWENEELLAVTRQIGLGHLRYPAGTLGNYWDWDTGWVDTTVVDSLMIRWVVENDLKHRASSYTLENLARGLEETGAVPVFMLNMLSKDLDHSLNNLRRARDLGMPIRYVELGNELYFDIPFPKLRFPTPEDYGRACARWIETLGAEFPEARFAVVGSSLERHPRQVDWTRRVLKYCPAADAVTYHKYGPGGLDGKRERAPLRPGEEGKGDAGSATREGPVDVAARQQWERNLLQDPTAWANLLTSARKHARGWKNINAPEGLEIWATEFNMRDDSSVVLHGWAQALLLSVYYGEFYDSPITLTSIHNLTGPTFGLLHQDEDGLAHLRDRPRKSEPFSVTAGGIVTALFSRVSAGAEDCRILDFPRAALLTDDRGETFPAVRAYHFHGATDRTLVVNYGLEPTTVALDPQLSGGTATHYAAAADQSISGWGDVTATEIKLTDDLITLEPRTITLIAAP